MDTSSLCAYIQEQLPNLTALRHDLHRHPELSFEETRTSQRVCDELDALGIAYKKGFAKGTGVVAHLPATETSTKTDQERLAVGLRADMDALPICENTDRAYASQTPGVMHACGHDGHTTILLGAARILSQLENRPNPVTLIFQPAEEDGGGGERMCEEGALLGDQGGGIGSRVGRIFGLHGWPQVPLGQMATKPGPLLAATDDFVLRICAKGGHAAFPHLTSDPILAAAHVVTALQSIASRNVDPVDALVITVGQIAGGSANNIIPTAVELIGTVRTLTAHTRTLARERFFAIVESTAQAFGCQVQIDWLDGYPATVNDPALTDHFLSVAKETFGKERVIRVESPVMGGEDFSYYGQHVPACFFMLGLLAPGQDPQTTPKLHQAEFDFNDDALETGIEMMVRLAVAHDATQTLANVQINTTNAARNGISARV